MPQITKRIRISASPEQVWNVLADFGSVQKWAPTLLESHCSSNLTRGIGAKRTLRTSTRHITEEVVTEWNEGHDFTFEIPDGLPSISVLQETWTLEESSQASEVAVTMDYQIKAGLIQTILNLLVVRRALEKMLIQNLAGLKHHVETGELVTAKTARLPVTAVV